MRRRALRRNASGLAHRPEDLVKGRAGPQDHVKANGRDGWALYRPRGGVGLEAALESLRQDPAALLRLAVNQERGRFSSEQAAQVILEQNVALSDLWRQQQ